MKKILLTSFNNVKKTFAAVMLMGIIDLISINHLELFPAVLIGCILAAFYIISTAARLSSIIGLSQEQAKRRMWVGLVLRLVMLLVVLFVGLKISEMVFFAMVGGFLTFYIVAHMGLIITSYKNSCYGDVNKK